MQGKMMISTGIGGVVLAASVYFLDPPQSVPRGEPATLLRSTHKNTPSGSEKVVVDFVERTGTILSGGDDKGDIEEFLSQNPSTRMRIQGTSWYRAFLRDGVDMDIFWEHLRNAQMIENILNQHPGLIDQIQYEEWWKMYLSGDIIPSQTLDGNLSAFLFIDEFSKKSPDIYEQIQKNPKWKESNLGDSLVMVDRKILLDGVLIQSEYYDTHPEVVERMSKFGLSKNSLYATDFSHGSATINAIEAIFYIENPLNFTGEVQDIFWKSEVGQGYKNGQVDPIVAFRYINTLIGGNKS